MTKRAIFQTPPSKNLINAGLLAARLGRGYGIFFMKLKYVIQIFLPILKPDSTPYEYR